MNKTTILSLAVLGMISSVEETSAMSKSKKGYEKCFGISKSKKNDCGNKSHACGQHAAKDGDSKEWISVPKGLCEKIVNGKLTPS